MKIKSIKDKMESLRELINRIIVSENYDSDYLIEKSQELDILIVQYIKEMKFAKKVFNDNYLSYSSEFETIIDRIKILEKNYHSIRIIDPFKKEVLELKKGELYTSNFKCFKFLGKQKVCENCISRKACKDDEIIMKTENFNNKIFIIIAIPILINGKKLSIELFKEIEGAYSMVKM